MTNEPVVVLRALRKHYGEVRALDGAEAVLPARLKRTTLSTTSACATARAEGRVGG